MLDDESPDSGSEPSGTTRQGWQQLAEYGQIGFILPMTVLVGWLAGRALDYWLHTKWLNLAGVILGSVAGFVQLLRSVLAIDNSDKSGKDGTA